MTEKMRQLSMFDAESAIADGAANIAKEPAKKSAKKSAKKPATDLMKIVAEKAPVPKKMKRTFSEEEISEILSGNVKFMTEKERKEKEASIKFKKDQRRIKRWVLDTEATNHDKLIFYQSSFNGEFYKALDTSALYFAYRLADRMGRKANVMVDTDRFAKAMYVASLVDIKKFAEQFKELEGGEPEITLDGVYIFPLKKPLDDNDIQILRQTENTRRDKMHSILKPQQMAPAVYQQVLMIIRQLAPRSEKLKDKIFRDSMLGSLREILVIYADFSNGIHNKEKTAELILSELGKIKANLIILGETRKWGAVPLASAGDKINMLEKLVEKDLKNENKK